MKLRYIISLSAGALFLTALVVFWPAVGVIRERHRLATECAPLRDVMLSLFSYSVTHNDEMPESLTDEEFVASLPPATKHFVVISELRYIKPDKESGDDAYLLEWRRGTETITVTRSGIFRRNVD